MNYKFFSILALGGILLDQFSKYLAFLYFQQPFIIIPGFFQFIYTENPGIAFSIPIGTFLSIVLSIFILIFGAILAPRHLNLKHRLSITVLALIASGAIGNIIDRLRLGAVIDFISIWRYPIFNLADSFITIGALLLIVFYKKIEQIHDRNK